jgi:Pyruvate/2-oxoacid:ferredoxin oxidoreductase gamma subunit
MGHTISLKRVKTLEIEKGMCVAPTGGVARDHGLGARSQPITNTAMMGAFARVLGTPPLDAVLEAIRAEMPAKREENAAAAREAYESVQLLGLVGEKAAKEAVS